MRFVVALLAGLTAFGAAAEANFQRSTVAASRSSIVPLQTIDYTITVRNDGTSAANYLHVKDAIPTAAMLVAASPEWTFLENDRALEWYGRVEPGQSQVLRVSLVTKPDSAGSRLSHRPEIHYDGNYWAVEHALDVDSPPAQEGLRFGRYNVTPVGMVALPFLFLIIGAYAFSFFSGFRRHAGGPLLIVISVGMLLLFGLTAYHDTRMKQAYLETRCTVVDSLAKFTEGSDTTSGGQRKRSGSWSPLFAVKYATAAGEVVSIGYGSESRLQFGSPKPAQRALMSLPRGGVAPCWYDPDEPQKVVLDRSIGGAYGFALIPLLTLILGIGIVTKGWSAGVPPAGPAASRRPGRRDGA